MQDLGSFHYLSTPKDREAAARLARTIATGDWVVFAGAGLSKPCGLPDACDVAVKIYESLSASDDREPPDYDDLARACSKYVFYNQPTGEAALIRFLQGVLDTSNKSPSQDHFLLLDLRPKEIFTTNPEDLWEKALKAIGEPFVPIIQNTDWQYTDGKFRLVKLHGDLGLPDSLVFTEDHYDLYPRRKEQLNAHLVDFFATDTFLFIGYRVRDANLRRELRRVVDEAQGCTREHFIVFASVSAFQRDDYRRYGLTAIALGSYDVLPQFLRDLQTEADRYTPKPRTKFTAGSAGLLPPIPEDAVLVAFGDQYQEARAAIQEWRLADAQVLIEQLLARLSPLADAAGATALQVREFRQRVILALGNVHAWRGYATKAVASYNEARRVGPLSPDRLQQAASLLMNAQAVKLLQGLLANGSLPPELSAKFDACLVLGEGDLPRAQSRLAEVPESGDVDVAILRTRLALRQETGASGRATLDALVAAWELALGTPPAMLEVAGLTEQFLRDIVVHGWPVSDVDRSELLAVARRRYDVSLQAFRRLGDAFPEGIVSATSMCLLFHKFLDEDERVAQLYEELDRTPVVTRARVVAGYLTRRTPIDLDTIETLSHDGFITTQERAVLVAHQFAHAGVVDRAEQELRDALRDPNDPGHHLALDGLVELLVKSGRYDEAEAIIQSDLHLPADARAALMSVVIRHRDGLERALAHLRDAISSNPSSVLLTETLVGMLTEALDQSAS